MPGWTRAVAEDGAFRAAFVQEVRRTYPFFPLVAARAAAPFEWHGHDFPEGQRVLLDLYGTNRHPAAWEAPEAFRPERFLEWPGDPFTMVPQGGGGHAINHRCPGEWSTIRLMDLFAEVLAGRLDLRVPESDLALDMSALPALPRGGFHLCDLSERRPS